MSVVTSNGKTTKDKNWKIKTKEYMKKVALFCKKYSVLAFVAIGIALFFLSMLLTAQFKTVSNTEELLQGKREAQLSDDLLTLQRKYNDLKEQYEEKSKVVEEYQNNSATNDTLIASMKSRIDNAEKLAGLTNLKGEGVIITLDDGEKTNNPETSSDPLVHDSDVLTVVNELWAAGAEAISVNGQRIISTSAIRCVGPVIQINYQKVAAPFEIKAIGNAQYLESAMNIKNGVADSIKAVGVKFSIKREKNIQIPKFSGTQSFKNATVDE